MLGEGAGAIAALGESTLITRWSRRISYIPPRGQPKNGQLRAGQQIGRFAQTIVGQNITKVTGTCETWLLS